MALFDKIFPRKTEVLKQARKKRGYQAAGTGRLFSSWTTQSFSADNEIRKSIKSLRARSRDLSMNNDYARRYLKLAVSNVTGPIGVKLQVKSRDLNGGLDTFANKKIEQAWKDWTKRQNCSNDQSMSWSDIQRVVIESVVRDGEVIVRKIRTSDNSHGFSLQVLEADHLDSDDDNESAKVRMGIQYDDNGRPVAYRLATRHPGDYRYGNESYKEKIIVPAKDIIHLYIKERPSQTRGIPWMVAAMTRLNNLGAYEEAEIVAARIAASKMGFFVTPSGDDYVGDDTDSAGNIMVDIAPGQFEQLPEGVDFKSFDPQHPTAQFDDFMKRTLMGISASLGVSYISLSNDISAANYSSLRAGSIEERDQWRVIQQWFIDAFCVPVYEAWLEMSLTTGMIGLPIEKYDKYNAPVFYARTWDWVDPQRDVQATILEIQNGLSTKTEALAEQGIDIEEIIEQQAEEQKLEDQYGVSKLPQKQPAGQTI